jgi:hypothetical protein
MTSAADLAASTNVSPVNETPSVSKESSRSDVTRDKALSALASHDDFYSRLDLPSVEEGRAVVTQRREAAVGGVEAAAKGVQVGAFEVQGPAAVVEGHVGHRVDQEGSPADEAGPGQCFGDVGPQENCLKVFDAGTRRDREPRLARGFNVLGATPRAQQDVGADNPDPQVPERIGAWGRESMSLVRSAEGLSHVAGLGFVPRKARQGSSVRLGGADLRCSFNSRPCHPVRLVEAAELIQKHHLPLESLDVAVLGGRVE